MAYGYHSEIEGNSLHNLSHIAQNFTNDLRIARTLNPVLSIHAREQESGYH